MEYPKLMTVMDALDLADSLLKVPEGKFIEALRITTPSRPPEDSMTLYASFMTLASGPAGGAAGFSFDSKPMKGALELMRRSDYVNQAHNSPLPRNEIVYFLKLLGNNPFASGFLDTILSEPKTLHPSVDLALTTEAIYSLMRDEIDHLMAITKMRQMMSIFRRK
jgi:hypothetical protein